jgi:hypothetical protein
VAIVIPVWGGGYLAKKRAVGDFSSIGLAFIDATSTAGTIEIIFFSRRQPLRRSKLDLLSRFACVEPTQTNDLYSALVGRTLSPVGEIFPRTQKHHPSDASVNRGC